MYGHKVRIWGSIDAVSQLALTNTSAFRSITSPAPRVSFGVVPDSIEQACAPGSSLYSCVRLVQTCGHASSGLHPIRHHPCSHLIAMLAGYEFHRLVFGSLFASLVAADVPENHLDTVTYAATGQPLAITV